MKQIDIIQIIPECVLLSFLLLIFFSIVNRKKLFISIKGKNLLLLYFLIWIIESSDRIYNVINGEFFIAIKYTNFSFADTFFYLFLVENLFKRGVLLKSIIIVFIIFINIFYKIEYRVFFLISDYIFNGILLLYFYFEISKFLKNRGTNFFEQNKFFINFIFGILFFIGFSYIIQLVVDVTSYFIPKLEDYEEMIYIFVIPFWFTFFIILIKYKINFLFIDTVLKSKLDKHSCKSDIKSKSDFKLLLEFVLQKKMYLNPKLTLELLQSDIGMDTRYISKLINTYEKVNFNDFINNLRIEEFKKNILKEEYKGYSILGVALESGFSSKSTFYKAFKKKEDMSPKEYLKSI
ncbi:Helix-turn-helix domain-containing protein [Tenacibaculum sp. 190524A02b]|uniref:helix-turn-helix domain-containing protein n=1 Tax=Tenacibaculum vairaonense TaxID=3137860 RepID=UPI0032B13752